MIPKNPQIAIEQKILPKNDRCLKVYSMSKNVVPYLARMLNK